MERQVLVTFLHHVTGEEIHNCNCCSNEVSYLYAEGNDIEINDVGYRVVDFVPCVNDNMSFKVYVIPK